MPCSRRNVGSTGTRSGTGRRRGGRLRSRPTCCYTKSGDTTSRRGHRHDRPDQLQLGRHDPRGDPCPGSARNIFSFKVSKFHFSTDPTTVTGATLASSEGGFLAASSSSAAANCCCATRILLMTDMGRLGFTNDCSRKKLSGSGKT